MPKISACIVAYCDYDEVCAAVRSVLANTPGDDFALYVVDNASPDGCGPRLAQTDFGDARVQVICLPKNLGPLRRAQGTPAGKNVRRVRAPRGAALQPAGARL